jgi:hypothetical protein
MRIYLESSLCGLTSPVVWRNWRGNQSDGDKHENDEGGDLSGRHSADVIGSARK